MIRVYLGDALWNRQRGGTTTISMIATKAVSIATTISRAIPEASVSNVQTIVLSSICRIALTKVRERQHVPLK